MQTGKRKKGDIREDGKVFWSYRKDIACGEYWINAEDFEKKKQQAKKAWAKYAKTEKGRLNILKKEQSPKRILSKKQYRKTPKAKEYYSAYAKSERGKQNRKRHQIKHKGKRNPYHRKWKQDKRKSDPMYKLICACRCRLNDVIRKKGFRKNGRTYEYLGCAYECLKNHLEKQFTAGMNWANYGEWEIDHILPLSLAKTESELTPLCHYTNLQPLWKHHNRSKGNKIPKE